MKRYFVLGSALVFVVFAAPSFASPPSAPQVAKADVGYDGRVDQLIMSGGVVQSILLDNGVSINTPPSASDDVTEFAEVGAVLRAFGPAHLGPTKQPVVDATRIVNLDTGASLVFKK